MTSGRTGFAVYPAQGSREILVCRDGFVIEGNNCVARRPWCNGWSGFNAANHTRHRVGICDEFRCTATGQGFTSDTNRACTACAHGVNATSGVCNLPPVPNPVTCPAGQYLAPNQQSCTQCETNHQCSGGTFTPNDTTQGRTPCPSGQTSPAGSSSCSTPPPDMVTCPAGQFMHATGTCRDCGTNFWCPGGPFDPDKKSDQGRNPCPSGHTTDNATASVDTHCRAPAPPPPPPQEEPPITPPPSAPDIRFSRTDMYFGPGGTATALHNQCWMVGNAAAFAECVRGR